MKPVHVLCDQDEALSRRLELVLQPCKGQVSGVGLAIGAPLPPLVVPATHQSRITGEGLRRRQLHRIVLGPQPRLGITESRDPALGRYAGPGQDGNRLRFMQEPADRPNLSLQLLFRHRRFQIRRRQSQVRVPPVWYSVTRVSKKFFSFFKSRISDIQGKGLVAP